MYGLVNKAMEEVIRQKYVEKFSLERWQDFRRLLIPEGDFQQFRQYPDELSYQMVGEASEALGLSAEELLEAMGRYWLLHTAKTGYGKLIQAFGKTPQDLLMRLDNLHTLLRSNYPSLSPPSFSCTDLSDDGLLLHYHSKRNGLTVFVVGLLKGLADHFQTEILIEIVQRKGEVHDHDIFKLRFSRPSTAS
jgi:hypothetical protein